MELPAFYRCDTFAIDKESHKSKLLQLSGRLLWVLYWNNKKQCPLLSHVEIHMKGLPWKTIVFASIPNTLNWVIFSHARWVS